MVAGVPAGGRRMLATARTTMRMGLRSPCRGSEMTRALRVNSLVRARLARTVVDRVAQLPRRPGGRGRRDRDRRRRGGRARRSTGLGELRPRRGEGQRAGHRGREVDLQMRRVVVLGLAGHRETGRPGDLDRGVGDRREASAVDADEERHGMRGRHRLRRRRVGVLGELEPVRGPPERRPGTAAAGIWPAVGIATSANAATAIAPASHLLSTGAMLLAHRGPAGERQTVLGSVTGPTPSSPRQAVSWK